MRPRAGQNRLGYRDIHRSLNHTERAQLLQWTHSKEYRASCPLHQMEELEVRR